MKNSDAAVFRLEGIGHHYGSLRVLSEVDLSFGKGELVLVIGPNGAGKTTLVSILSCLLKPSSGAILWRGEDIRNNLEAWKRNIGVVHEELFLFETLSLRENLLYTGNLYDLGPDEVDARTGVLLEWFELADRENSPACEASFGMRKKLALAMALLHNPEILFLDEALNGIDILSGWNIKRLLRRLADGGKTVVMCTHNLGAAFDIADRLVVIDAGRVARDLASSGVDRNPEELYLEALGRADGEKKGIPWLT